MKVKETIAFQNSRKQLTMKKILFCLIYILPFFFLKIGFSQYSLEDAILEAQNNSPLAKMRPLNNELANLKIANISKSYYPKIGASAQATYQSEVTELPLELPGMSFDPLSKDQYKIQGEIKQFLYAGGAPNIMKDIMKHSLEVENLDNQVELENIRASIIKAYYSILELDAKIKILDLKKENLNTQIGPLESAIQLGIMEPSNLDELNATIISIDQEILTVYAYRKKVVKTLEDMTGRDLPENNIFSVPEPIFKSNTDYSVKPILKKLELQKQILTQNQALSESYSRPNAIAFVNIGYGKPAFNFLRNSFEPYGIGGIKLSWSLDNLYTKGKERQILKLNQDKIDLKKDLVKEQIDLQRNQYEIEIELLEQLLIQDQEILNLRKSLRTNAEAKLKNGSLTASKLIPFINEESDVLERISLRKILINKYKYLNDHISGNYLN